MGFCPKYICFDPVTATLIIAGLAGAAGTAYSAREERKGAESAARTQAEIAAQQLQATKDAETMAQTTAESQRKAAVARKQNTILTTPLGAQVSDQQLNQPSILGVPR